MKAEQFTLEQQTLISNTFLEVAEETISLVSYELCIPEEIKLNLFIEPARGNEITGGFIDARRPNMIHMNIATIGVFKRIDRWLMNTALVAAHEMRHIHQALNGQDLIGEQVLPYKEQPCEIDANEYSLEFLKNEKLLIMIGEKLDRLCDYGIDC